MHHCPPVSAAVDLCTSGYVRIRTSHSPRLCISSPRCTTVTKLPSCDYQLHARPAVNTNTTSTTNTILDFINQLITTYTTNFTAHTTAVYSEDDPEATMTPAKPVVHPPPFKLNADRSKWTVDVVEKVLAAADASAPKSTVGVIGRPGSVRPANQVFYALPEAKVDGIQQEWTFTMIDMRTGLGRLFVIADGPEDPRHDIRPPPRTKAQGHSNAFEMTVLPHELRVMPVHVVVCLVLIWLTRMDPWTRLASIDRLRINAEHALADVNALLRGEKWPGNSVYLMALPKRKVTFRDDSSRWKRSRTRSNSSTTLPAIE